jgi:hypothetical protein
MTRTPAVYHSGADRLPPQATTTRPHAPASPATTAIVIFDSHQRPITHHGNV